MFNLLSFCSAGHGLFIYVYMAFLLCEYIFQNIELNAAHHLRFSVETLWSPKTMLLIKSPKIWVSMRAITFCWCVLWKACITWHFWARNRKLTFSWKITPQGAIPPLNSSLPGQNGHCFTYDIFRYIFVNEKFCTLIKISLKFVPKGPIDNNPALVQIMAWHRIGDKPLSKPMLIPFTDIYAALGGDE